MEVYSTQFSSPFTTISAISIVFSIIGMILGVFVSNKTSLFGGVFQLIALFLIVLDLSISKSKKLNSDDVNMILEPYTEQGIKNYKSYINIFNEFLLPNLEDSELDSKYQTFNRNLLDLIDLRNATYQMYQQREISETTVDKDSQDIMEQLEDSYIQTNNSYKQFQTKMDNFKNKINNNIKQMENYYNVYNDSFKTQIDVTKFWGRHTTDQLKNIVNNISKYLDNLLPQIKGNISDKSNIFYLSSLTYQNNNIKNVNLSNYYSYFQNFNAQSNTYNHNIYFKINKTVDILSQMVQQTINKSIEFYNCFFPIIINNDLFIAKKLIMKDNKDYIDENMIYKYNEKEILLTSTDSKLFCYFNLIANLLVYVIYDEKGNPIDCFCCAPNIIYKMPNIIYDYSAINASQITIDNQLTIKVLNNNQQCITLPANKFKNVFYFAFSSDANTVKFYLNINGVTIPIETDLKSTIFNNIVVFTQSETYIVMVCNSIGCSIQKYEQSGINFKKVFSFSLNQ